MVVDPTFGDAEYGVGCRLAQGLRMIPRERCRARALNCSALADADGLSKATLAQMENESNAEVFVISS